MLTAGVVGALLAGGIATAAPAQAHRWVDASGIRTCGTGTNVRTRATRNGNPGVVRITAGAVRSETSVPGGGISATASSSVARWSVIGHEVHWHTVGCI